MFRKTFDFFQTALQKRNCAKCLPTINYEKKGFLLPLPAAARLFYDVPHYYANVNMV